MKDAWFLIWTFVVMILCTLILYIGLYEKKNEESITIKNEFKSIVNKYIDLEEKKIPFNESIVITKEELISKQYEYEVKYEEKLCTGDITVKNFFILKTYDVDYTCE